MTDVAHQSAPLPFVAVANGKHEPRLTCPQCGGTRAKSRSTQVYCSDRCKWRAWDERHPRQAAREQEKRRASQERFRAFCAFHAQNPHVYRLFRQFAGVAYDAGLRRCGARLIWEQIRWHALVVTKSADDYKLNNNIAPYMSRLLMLREERFRGFFERRDKRFDVDDEALVAGVRAAESEIATTQPSERDRNAEFLPNRQRNPDVVPVDPGDAVAPESLDVPDAPS